MNKTDKEYTVRRIRDVLNSKLIKCECEGPKLVEHLRKGAVNGELKLKSAKDINKVYAANVTQGEVNRWHRDAIPCDEIFHSPKSYLDEMKKHEAEKKVVDEMNKKLKAKFDLLIDDVNLGKFEDGADAIKQAFNLK